jgi:hypothetical protein
MASLAPIAFGFSQTFFLEESVSFPQEKSESAVADCLPRSVKQYRNIWTPSAWRPRGKTVTSPHGVFIHKTPYATGNSNIKRYG